VTGIEGKPTIETMNAFGGRNEDYESLTHEVKAIVGGPTAKAFNINYARLFDRVDEQPERPGNLYVAEDEVRDVTEQLTRDAGYEPINLGGLENARLLEDQMRMAGAISNGGLGVFFYRYWSA
jgi:8-hydroxy-5-deazaflavin:NADPH oxidoreductase